MTNQSGAQPPDLPARHSLPTPPLERARSREHPRRGATIALSALLTLAVAGLVVLAVLLVQLRGAIADLQLELDRTTEEVRDLEREVAEQQELLDEKEIFGQSMRDLMTTVQSFDGVPVGGLVDFGALDRLAQGAWIDRRDPAAVRDHAIEVEWIRAELDAHLEAAAARAGSSAGTAAEALIDSLGQGFVETVWGDAAAVCQSDALGCVWSGEPTRVYLDATGFAEPYRTEWGEILVAYHEFAHVLQFTNPGPTADALSAFGGDSETMADCYALTMLDSWTLSERVWVDDRRYWDVSYGYGSVCGDGEREVIRAWLTEVGVKVRPVSQ